MDEIPKILITLGGLFLLGLFTVLLGRQTFLPRVTLLLLSGFAIGPSGFDVLPDFREDWFPVVTNIAVSMVGFLVGHHLTLRSLKKRGKPVLWISIGEVVGAATAMFLGHILMGFPPEVALLLAGIAPASDPVAIIDVIRVDGHSSLPQAGVTLGMALLASQHLPELKEVILPVAIGSTIVFELIGPVMTRKALIKVGEGQTHNGMGT
ncbi:MAG: cation:proton antiporter [Nitrospirales bacterium]|nr:cation:proton antiporter [Nitrospirales bacterium]